MINYLNIIKIIKNQVKPALGCTEPGAVAYGVARAKEIIGEEVQEIEIITDKNIMKNGLVVGIPGTEEEGIIFAAALSLIIGKSEYGLEVLKDLSQEDIDLAQGIVDSKIISLDYDKSKEGLYIHIRARGANNTSTVIIENSHTNIVLEKKNQEILFDKNLDQVKENAGSKENKEIKYNLKNYTFDELFDFVDRVDIGDIDFIQDGMKMNMTMAEVGLSGKLKTRMGIEFYNKAENTISKAKAYTIAASEARMVGWPLPVMSSAGSGNHGLVAIIPPTYIGEALGLPREKIIRAITLSHLITIYVKVHIGSLSPVCGCGVAAGIGCAAALTYLNGGNRGQIKTSINNMIGGLAGMVCDGAKFGCAYKLGISVTAAADASFMALRNIEIPPSNGIIGDSPEQSIRNLARLSIAGMKAVDQTILEIMLAKLK